MGQLVVGNVEASQEMKTRERIEALNQVLGQIQLLQESQRSEHEETALDAVDREVEILEAREAADINDRLKEIVSKVQMPQRCRVKD